MHHCDRFTFPKTTALKGLNNGKQKRKNIDAMRKGDMYLFLNLLSLCFDFTFFSQLTLTLNQDNSLSFHFIFVCPIDVGGSNHFGKGTG